MVPKTCFRVRLGSVCRAWLLIAFASVLTLLAVGSFEAGRAWLRDGGGSPTLRPSAFGQPITRIGSATLRGRARGLGLGLVAKHFIDRAAAVPALSVPTAVEPEDSTIHARVYTSPDTGRKFMASVVGLADDTDVYGKNAARMPAFFEAWRRAWPGLHIEHQHAFMNHRNLLGYGCAAGHYLALTKSLQYLRVHNETCDYHLVFEDDALPFNGTTWPAFGAENDLETKLGFFTHCKSCS